MSFQSFSQENAHGLIKRGKENNAESPISSLLSKRRHCSDDDSEWYRSSATKTQDGLIERNVREQLALNATMQEGDSDSDEAECPLTQPVSDDVDGDEFEGVFNFLFQMDEGLFITQFAAQRPSGNHVDGSAENISGI